MFSMSSATRQYILRIYLVQIGVQNGDRMYFRDRSHDVVERERRVESDLCGRLRVMWSEVEIGVGQCPS